MLTLDYSRDILRISYDKKELLVIMKLTKDMSIKLSMICVCVFSVILLAADIFAYRWIGMYVRWRLMASENVARMMITLYSASVFGWICLWALWKLLKNMNAEIVFEGENVKLLRIISWCCAFAAVIFLVSALYYPPCILVAVAAAFMMLIVRVVKNVFQQANDMKSELDLTI